LLSQGFDAETCRRVGRVKRSAADLRSSSG
jgi:hypothetical protein